jgi:hypothetical protein
MINLSGRKNNDYPVLSVHHSKLKTRDLSLIIGYSARKVFSEINYPLILVYQKGKTWDFKVCPECINAF